MMLPRILATAFTDDLKVDSFSKALRFTTFRRLRECSALLTSRQSFCRLSNPAVASVTTSDICEVVSDSWAMAGWSIASSAAWKVPAMPAKLTALSSSSLPSGSVSPGEGAVGLRRPAPPPPPPSPPWLLPPAPPTVLFGRVETSTKARVTTAPPATPRRGFTADPPPPPPCQMASRTLPTKPGVQLSPSLSLSSSVCEELSSSSSVAPLSESSSSVPSLWPPGFAIASAMKTASRNASPMSVATWSNFTCC